MTKLARVQVGLNQSAISNLFDFSNADMGGF
jgi:hypothetical protein